MCNPLVVTALDEKGEVLVPWCNVTKFSSKLRVRDDRRTIYEQYYMHTSDGAKYRVSSALVAKLHVVELCEYDDDGALL
jgi:hypothetical protein